MELSLVANILLPSLLVVIMFGLGLSLTFADFHRVALHPKPVFAGLTTQIIILPLAAFGICHIFGLHTGYAVGLMLVAASPGAPTANLYSKLVGADVPLNLTLTAMNSLISTLTLPLITTLAIAYYATETAAFEFPRNRIVEIFFLVTIPVIAGIFTNRHYPVLARKLDKPIRVFSVVTLIVIIVGAVAKEFDLLKDNIATIGWSILVFNLLSLSVAYFIPNILGVAKRSCSAIMFGSGLHNGSIPLFVAVSVLNSREAVVPIGLYTIIAYFTAGLAGLIVKRYHESEEVLTPQRKAS